MTAGLPGEANTQEATIIEPSSIHPETLYGLRGACQTDWDIVVVSPPVERTSSVLPVRDLRRPRETSARHKSMRVWRPHDAQWLAICDFRQSLMSPPQNITMHACLQLRVVERVGAITLGTSCGERGSTSSIQTGKREVTEQDRAHAVRHVQEVLSTDPIFRPRSDRIVLDHSGAAAHTTAASHAAPLGYNTVQSRANMNTH